MTPVLKMSSCKKPKKPLSAYIFYSQEQREIVKKRYPHWSTKDIMRFVSDNWSMLPKHQKDHYVQLANQDKKRFEQELSELRNTRVLHETLSSKKKPPEARSLRAAME